MHAHIIVHYFPIFGLHHLQGDDKKYKGFKNKVHNYPIHFGHWRQSEPGTYIGSIAHVALS